MLNKYGEGLPSPYVTMGSGCLGVLVLYAVTSVLWTFGLHFLSVLVGIMIFIGGFISLIALAEAAHL
ncbi:MAG: hypothetical protein H8D23_11010 [Candidatus Brocadiales bacterium]|nr:hypothetical protein [Candidatus Brocadiales bacterium]